jgi:hypothetical protein
MVFITKLFLSNIIAPVGRSWAASAFCGFCLPLQDAQTNARA